VSLVPPRHQQRQGPPGSDLLEPFLDRGGSGPLRAGEELPEPDAVRFPFGSLYPHILPTDTVSPFTFEGSKEANNGWYNPQLSPGNPYTFDVMTYTVPKAQALVVLGYSIAADRQAGPGPYDTEPIAHGRMRQSWLFDLTVSGAHPDRVLHFEVIPTPIVQRGAGTGLPQSPLANAFASAPARQAQSTGGAGLAALPFDARMYGPDNAPFTLLVPQGRTIAGRVSIQRQLSVPLADIRFRVDGFLFPVTLLKKYRSVLQP
jgi:hypothetical protein